MTHTSTLELGRKLNTTGAGVFLDFYEPAYGEVVTPDATFRLDSITPVAEGAPARLALREQQTNKLIAIIPFEYRKSFTLPEITRQAQDFLKEESYKYISPETFSLRDGDFKVAVSAQSADEVVKTREHKFSVGVGSQDQDSMDHCVIELNGDAVPAVQPQRPVVKHEMKGEPGRFYCVYAYKDLLLREHGSMPCCNLIRDEKLLYSTYAEGGYDPWNNDAWKALRQSLVDGEPKYCHSNCQYLTSGPVPKDEFIDVVGSSGSPDDEERYRAYVKGDVDLKVGPSRLSIMVGTICNIDCIFCPIPFLNNRRTVFTENMLVLLQKHIGGCRRITFTGGEPLVYIKELRKLEEYFHKDLTVQIITNGIAANHLIEFGGPAHLSLRVSLNCANRDDYIYLHEKDFFDRIVKNLRLLKAARPDTFLSLKFIIMERTAGDVLNFARLCADIGADECAYTPVYIKELSKISPDEKLLPSSENWEIANSQLEEARALCESRGMMFCWCGWDTRPDDYQKKAKQVVAQGDDAFAWAEG